MKFLLKTQKKSDDLSELNEILNEHILYESDDEITIKYLSLIFKSLINLPSLIYPEPKHEIVCY
jgi:hypothetical protein